VVKELRLNEFKALYKTWKRNVVWFDHLLLGLLLYLERKLIDNRVKVEIDEAIKTWETLHSPASPIYTETPSKTPTRLPELRLTAPWYDPVDDGSEGG